MKQLKLLFLFNVFFLNTSLYGQVESEPICIGEKFIIKSKVLNQEREIFIRLPQNYENTDSIYPIHYVLDGEATFSSYSSIVELKSHNKEIPKAITIGIPNIDRNFDFDPRGNGVNFLEFITKELIPFVDKKYRTNKKRIIIGYSLGGNFVMYAFFNGTEFFNMFLSGSPYRLDLFLNYDMDSFNDNGETKKIVYTSMGNNDQAKQLEFFNVFCDQLEKKNNSSVDFKYEVVANRNHDNNFLINWQDGLDYFYKDWRNESK